MSDNSAVVVLLLRDRKKIKLNLRIEKKQKDDFGI